MFENGVCTPDAYMFAFGSCRVLARKLGSKLTPSLNPVLLTQGRNGPRVTSSEGHPISSLPMETTLSLETD